MPQPHAPSQLVSFEGLGQGGAVEDGGWRELRGEPWSG
jgi:hypothetical protein